LDAIFVPPATCALAARPSNKTAAVKTSQSVVTAPASERKDFGPDPMRRHLDVNIWESIGRKLRLASQFPAFEFLGQYMIISPIRSNMETIIPNLGQIFTILGKHHDGYRYGCGLQVWQFYRLLAYGAALAKRQYFPLDTPVAPCFPKPLYAGPHSPRKTRPQKGAFRSCKSRKDGA
jgi:hypothetical protein